MPPQRIEFPRVEMPVGKTEFPRQEFPRKEEKRPPPTLDQLFNSVVASSQPGVEAKLAILDAVARSALAEAARATALASVLENKLRQQDGNPEFPDDLVGTGGSGAFPVKVTGGGAGIYQIDIYEDGLMEPSTGTGTLEVPTLLMSEEIPAGTVVVAVESSVSLAEG